MSKWNSGPPPSVGWWPASRCRDYSGMRWWNGACWSINFNRENNGFVRASEADTSDARAPTIEDRPIEWRHRPKSWPKRSHT